MGSNLAQNSVSFEPSEGKWGSVRVLCIKGIEIDPFTNSTGTYRTRGRPEWVGDPPKGVKFPALV
jgi:hypothetical protein